MKSLDTQLLLSLIKEEFNINKYLYPLYENTQPTGFYFYGNNNNKIFVRGNGDEVVFSFSNSRDKETGFVSLDLHTCKELLTYFYSFHIKENGFDLNDEIYGNFVKEELSVVTKYLGGYNRSCTMDVHEALLIPNKGPIAHKLLLGSILHWCRDEEIASKKTINIIGSITIPLTFSKAENYWVHFGLLIPNWDIKKYPSIHNSFVFTEYDQNIKDKSVKTIEDFIEQTSLNCTSISKTLMYKLLNTKIPNKNENFKKKKI